MPFLEKKIFVFKKEKYLINCLHQMHALKLQFHIKCILNFIYRFFNCMAFPVKNIFFFEKIE